MKEERKIKGYGRTTVTFEENGKFYIQVDAVESKIGKANYTATYIEIDKKEYEGRLKKLASQIANNPNVKMEDVIFDALRDYPLGHIESYEKAVVRELKKGKPDIKTKKGFCCELVIGKSYSFVLHN